MRANVTTANLTRSRGIALIAGLMLMTSMVLLALAIATGVSLERRMAGNFSDAQLALGRAKIAQRWGEHWLYGQAANPLGSECETDCQDHLVYPQGTLPVSPELKNSEWWQLNGQAAGINPVTGLVHLDYTLSGTEDPRWLIEEVHSHPIENGDNPGEIALTYYRVLARGTGRWPGSIAVTESIIARPWIDSLEPSPFPPSPGAGWLCESVTADINCGRMGWRRIR